MRMQAVVTLLWNRVDRHAQGIVSLVFLLSLQVGVRLGLPQTWLAVHW